MTHAFVTVVVEFDGKKAGAVNDHLDALGNLERSVVSGPLDRSAFVHFMSLTVVRGSPGGFAHLVLSASADGHPGGVLRRLAREIGPQLCDVLTLAGVSVDKSQLGEFLVRHNRDIVRGWFAVPGVVFTGTPGMTVGRILREEELASRIQQGLDDLRMQNSALTTLERLREQLFAEGIYKWAFVAEPVPLLAEAPKRWMWRVSWSTVRTFLWPLLVLPALAFVWKGLWPAILTLGWPLLIFPALVLMGQGIVAASWALFAELLFVPVAVVIAYAWLRHKEDTDVPDDREPGAQAIGELMARENEGLQNHLAAVSTMKRGWLRHLVLRLVFGVFAALVEYRSRPGFLSNIGTIHFARWILLPGTDKLLFFSDYSGSWESYLEDFIVRAREGLTAVWSNTQGFPRTKRLREGGAARGDQFKRWARRQQEPTRFWYSAYPNLTTGRIRTNAAIRKGFATASTEPEAARWLVNFGFAPPRTTVETDSIPTLVFGGLPGLHCGRSFVLRFSEVGDDMRAWLAEIELDIGYGERMPANSTLVLGLSESGLRKLGLDEQALSTFPVAFRHGMAAPWRSRALGDVGENAPDRWWWGNLGNKADAILNIYARCEGILDQEIQRRTEQLWRRGITIIHEILLDKIPPKDVPIREPFGFTDGISQPIVRGARKWVIARNPIHVVEPGEMILGYPDNFNDIPRSPSTATGRDLGRNGTYFVVRQLEQDKAAFEKCLAEAAERLVVARDPRAPAGTVEEVAGWIGAKIVGRWKDGTSLVRHPDRPGSVSRPGTPPDNDFQFGVEDPDGLRCPFGAHIRRVNPRESFEPGSEKQLRISNRHRIFRVGRRYVPHNRWSNQGLLFMCVNANIERQFEFMQQTYMLGSSFHGLENEIDSFARRPGLSDMVTIPTERGPLRIQGMGSFITVRGGGYFFMPGRATIRFLIDGT